MGAAGRERVRAMFTTEAMMRAMDKLYADALRAYAQRAKPHS